MIEIPKQKKEYKIEESFNLSREGLLSQLMVEVGKGIKTACEKGACRYRLEYDDYHNSPIMVYYEYYREETEEEFNKRVEEYETRVRECKSTLDFIRENYGDEFIREHLNYKEE